MNLFQFMSESPWLTFFLALVIGECVFRTVWAIANACAGHKTEIKDIDE